MSSGFLNCISQAKHGEANSDTVDEIFSKARNSINNTYRTLRKSQLSKMTNHFENNKKHIKARERLRSKLESRKSGN